MGWDSKCFRFLAIWSLFLAISVGSQSFVPADRRATRSHDRNDENSPVRLKCTSDMGSSYRVSGTIQANISQLAPLGFTPSCPCAFDPTGRCRQHRHLCTASQATFSCMFTAHGVLVTEWGAIVDQQSGKTFDFGDETMVGGHDPQYFPGISTMFIEGISMARKKHHAGGPIHRADVVVPMRMRWDDCFNHLSFQSMPLLGLMFEVYPTLASTVHWHTSRFTAALLMLLGVPKNRIIIEESVAAQTVILPWIQYWNPFQLALPQGIAHRTSLKLTEALLKRQFSDELRRSVTQISPLDYQYTPIPDWQTRFPADHRFIVYLNRTRTGTRTVPNEHELLQLLQEHLKPEYHLIVLGPTHEYRQLEQLHVLWQQYAQIVNRAVVLLGPHGGGMNNMMWAPADCDLIEFNEYPDDAQYTMSHGKTPVQSVFMSAFHTRSVPGDTNFTTAKYWTIAATKKHPFNFYHGRMRIAPRDLLHVFAQVKGGSLLKDNSVWKKFPQEAVTIWDKPPSPGEVGSSGAIIQPHVQQQQQQRGKRHGPH